MVSEDRGREIGANVVILQHEIIQLRGKVSDLRAEIRAKEEQVESLWAELKGESPAPSDGDSTRDSVELAEASKRVIPDGSRKTSWGWRAPDGRLILNDYKPETIQKLAGYCYQNNVQFPEELINKPK